MTTWRADAPIFIGGAPRSGTTLLRAIVNASDTIVCGPEMRVVPALCGIAEQVETAAAPVLETGYGLDREAVQAAFARSIEAFLAPLRQASGARVAEKTPANILHFPRLRRLFPDSPLIAIIRDPRDVAASLLSMDWTDARTGRRMAITTDVSAAARLWAASIDAAEAMRGDPGFYALRYEDLVARPRETIAALFDFLDEDGASLERALAHHRHFRPEQGEAESSAARVARPLDTTALARWRRDLTPAQAATIESIAGDRLRAWSYV